MKFQSIFIPSFVIPTCALLVGTIAALPAESATLEFNRDVRPILAENCFQCHGPDSASRKGDLRLDKRDAAVEAGAIVPGNPKTSELVNRIFSADADEVMPPAEAHKDLKPAQREVLKRWIAEGAEYQPHWSFIAPQRPVVPPVK
ncbi:MAG TPA: c-type cytochrome domain-containing protein, partial [Pirellulales bacterium]